MIYGGSLKTLPYIAQSNMEPRRPPFEIVPLPISSVPWKLVLEYSYSRTPYYFWGFPQFPFLER